MWSFSPFRWMDGSAVVERPGPFPRLGEGLAQTLWNLRWDSPCPGPRQALCHLCVPRAPAPAPGKWGCMRFPQSRGWYGIFQSPEFPGEGLPRRSLSTGLGRRGLSKDMRSSRPDLGPIPRRCHSINPCTPASCAPKSWGDRATAFCISVQTAPITRKSHSDTDCWDYTDFFYSAVFILQYSIVFHEFVFQQAARWWCCCCRLPTCLLRSLGLENREQMKRLSRGVSSGQKTWQFHVSGSGSERWRGLAPGWVRRNERGVYQLTDPVLAAAGMT